MRIEELRINNKVQDNNGFVFDIVAIFKDGTIYCDFEGNEGDVWEFDDNNPYQGIQLTEEILLKCEGVKRINEWQYKLNDWFLIERYTTKEKWSVRKVISEENSILLCFIDFLHEFQNIIHALTNRELIVEL